MTISKIYIDAAVAGRSDVARILARLQRPSETISDARALYRRIADAADPVQAGKQVLYLTRNRGAFIKPCPGTRCYTCCGYQILHIGTYCTMDCSYCIMQSYFHPPVLQYFVNESDMMAELALFWERKQISRIGTGEFTDSLIWEPWTDLSRRLVPRFADQDRAVLELKSKTTAIANLKDLAHNRKTIMAWSLNAPRIVAEQERGTASIGARLAAAAQCAKWGYPLAFHFDPMVLYDGCQQDYQSVVQQLFATIRADDIIWISLGALRFMPALKPIMQSRFPNSKIALGEFIPGMDGKMRYFKPLRIELYRKMVSWIRAEAPHTALYFCMEDDEVWRKATGYTPAERGGLPRILDERAVEMCGLDPGLLKLPYRSE
jgi:spore photoproduct lyase